MRITPVLACALLAACGSDPSSSPDAAPVDGAGASPDAAAVADAAPAAMDARSLPDFPAAMDAPLSPDAAPDLAIVMDTLLLPDFPPATDLPPSPPVQCTGSFAGITQAQLAAAIAPSGQCRSSADVALICTGNVANIAGVCGVGCASGPQAMFKTCATACLRAMVMLSEACAGCYADTVACTQQNCLNQCIANPAAPACLQCQVVKGCQAAFQMCTGLPGNVARDAGTD